ncbi:hypothetical protein [Limibacillus halophilus]
MSRRDQGSGLDLAKGSVLRHFGAGLVVVLIGGYGVYSGASYVKQNFRSFLGQVDTQYAEHKDIAEVMLAKHMIPGYFEGELAYFPLWRPIAQALPGALETTPAPLKDWRAFAEGLNGKPVKEKRKKIAAYLAQVRFRADQGKSAWAAPEEIAERGYGDAEDMAGLAYYMALASGHPPEALVIAHGRDRRGHEHAYVLMEEGGEIWTLHFADPGAAPLNRSGFTPKAFGQTYRTIIPTNQAGG